MGSAHLLILTLLRCIQPRNGSGASSSFSIKIISYQLTQAQHKISYTSVRYRLLERLFQYHSANKATLQPNQHTTQQISWVRVLCASTIPLVTGKYHLSRFVVVNKNNNNKEHNIGHGQMPCMRTSRINLVWKCERKRGWSGKVGGIELAYEQKHLENIFFHTITIQYSYFSDAN